METSSQMGQGSNQEKKAEKKIGPHDEIERLIKNSFPVSYAKFRQAVDNADGTPETFFSEKSNTPSRNVQMWGSYSYLICLHKGLYIPVPLENVIFMKAK